MKEHTNERIVRIPIGPVTLEGVLEIPEGAVALVIFVHGSGSSRHSPRNKYVAETLVDAGIGTLLFDLLTSEEDTLYEKRFDIDVLTERLVAVTHWARQHPRTKDMKIGYFGASTGAAAALRAAAAFGKKIGAVVSRGGRPDLTGEALPTVESPTLLIVGGDDDVVVQLNAGAYKTIKAEKELNIVPGATHLFEEPGKLEQVAHLASEWFKKYLG
ncbi:MAG: alpha/beta family hydrolase [Nitrospirota bacterium]